MPYVYTLANAKGGCGKSTVALNLAVCFARAGYRTFAVDLDQQGNLSAALGADLNKLKLTAHRLLIDDEAEIGSFLLEPRPRLKLLPNTIDVEADDLLEAKKVNRELLLRRKLRRGSPRLRHRRHRHSAGHAGRHAQWLGSGRHGTHSRRRQQLFRAAGTQPAASGRRCCSRCPQARHGHSCADHHVQPPPSGGHRLHVLRAPNQELS